jgi:hypothetical protein
MTRQTSDSKKRDGDTNITVLFGTDEHGKPRAAYFEAVDCELMTRAAAAMKLQLLRPITASQIELAKKLPVGRIHANGTGFVPPIRPDLYSALQLTSSRIASTIWHDSFNRCPIASCGTGCANSRPPERLGQH